MCQYAQTSKSAPVQQAGSLALRWASPHLLLIPWTVSPRTSATPGDTTYTLTFVVVGRILPSLLLIEKDPLASWKNKQSPEYSTLLRSGPIRITHLASFPPACTGVASHQDAITMATTEPAFTSRDLLARALQKIGGFPFVSRFDHPSQLCFP